MADQCVFIRGFQAKRDLLGIKAIQIGSGMADENPCRTITLQRNIGLPIALGDDSHFGSSSLDTIVPINLGNPQLLPYPSSSGTIQSNGSIYNTSFMTSPSHDSGSLIEVLNDIAVMIVCTNCHVRTPSPRILQTSPMIMIFPLLMIQYVPSQNA